MTAAAALLDGIATLFRAMAAVFLAIMLAINIVNVGSRALFDTAFSWVFPWTLLLFVWTIFFGFFAYLRGRRDVVVDIVAKLLPGGGRRALAIFGNLVGMAFMIAILRGAPDLIALQQAPMETIDLPIYVRGLPLFISAVLVMAHFALHIAELVTGKAEPFAGPPAPASEGAPE